MVLWVSIFLHHNDEDYVSGLSITYSSNPRQHIWTFASGLVKEIAIWNCPCLLLGNVLFLVGNNYYCESGSVNRPNRATHFFSDILWDGAGCLGNSKCCSDTTQPWFYRQLNQTTQDDIEARICAHGHFSARSTLIDQFELYIQ